MLSRGVIVAVCVAIAVAFALVIRRRVPYSLLEQNHPFTGVTYAIVGAVYGVYLAFTIVVVWQQFDQAEQNATAEAVHLSAVWRDLEVLPAPVRKEVEP
jgi:Ca2+/H+ antiporter